MLQITLVTKPYSFMALNSISTHISFPNLFSLNAARKGLVSILAVFDYCQLKETRLPHLVFKVQLATQYVVGK